MWDGMVHEICVAVRRPGTTLSRESMLNSLILLCATSWLYNSWNRSLANCPWIITIKQHKTAQNCAILVLLWSVWLYICCHEQPFIRIKFLYCIVLYCIIMNCAYSKERSAVHVLLSASLYFSKRGAYWDRLCRDVVGRWLSRACTVAKWCILGL